MRVNTIGTYTEVVKKKYFLLVPLNKTNNFHPQVYNFQAKENLFVISLSFLFEYPIYIIT